MSADAQAIRADTNLIESSGLPTFFKISEMDGGTLPPPENRFGESVRLWARSLSVMQKEAIVLSARTGQAWRLASDEGPYLDGFDAAPCPLAFLTTGMVASYTNEIVALAQQEGISIRHLVLVQDNYYSMEGSALRGTMTGGALPADLELKIDTDADEATLRNLLMNAVAASPLNGLMRGVHRSRFSLTLNGENIAVDAVSAIEPLAQADPRAVIISLGAMGMSVDEPLIHRLDPVEVLEDVEGGAHSSLKESQSRKLHLRAICSRRPDGVKKIKQQLFSPLGSTFRFLSDEAEGCGGRGAAPDAVSYMSAGIGFCFMTQMGRYAKIVKKHLDEYNIIQDAHFSLGGASDGTGQAGHADPVETHVYLTTSEREDFAPKVVAMGEQTCFLHAFCRTDLKTRVRITRM